MKIRSLIIAFALLFTSIHESSAAAKPIPGAKCSKANISQISGNKKFTCVLKNKKLVWNSGTTIKTAPVAEKSNSEVNKTSITEFADLAKYVDLSAETAWKKTMEQINTNKTPIYQLEIIIGPTTKPDTLNPLYSKYSTKDYLDMVARLYASTPPAHQTFIVYSNYNDREWMAQKLDQLCGDNPRCGSDFLRECDPVNKTCGSAFATTGTQYKNGILAISSPETPWKIYTENIGTTEVHEFTHRIQHSQATQSTAVRLNEVPRWFMEGEANLNQLFLGGYYNNIGKYQTTDIKQVAPSFTYGEYQVNRKAQIDMMKNSANDKEFFMDFLNSPNEVFWQSSPYSQKQTYFYGAMFVESLRAIKGPQAEMSLISLVTNGKNYSDAFKEIYGIDWEKAKIILAEAAAKKFAS